MRSLPMLVFMVGERISEGWLVRMKPSGAGRFFPAAFLCFWLCGWAVGEFIVLSILAKGALAIMSGTPLGSEGNPLAVGPAALGVGAFLLFWLCLWTLGGMAALSEVLRLLWSEDRLLAHPGGLTVARSLGPFRRRREIPRDTIRRVLLAHRSKALTVETAQGTIELSRHGSVSLRHEIANALRSELRLVEATSVADGAAGVAPTMPASGGVLGVGGLPKGWEEIITPEGERAVVLDRRTQRAQSRAFALVALLVAAASVAAFRETARGSVAIPFAIVGALAALGLAWGTVQMARGRKEWRIGSGRIAMRKRFGSEVKDAFEAHRLELTVTVDSDGDEWFALEAITDLGVTPTMGARTPVAGHRSAGRPKHRERVASALHDPFVPRALGAWLARAASVPFEDRTSPETRDAEVVQLREQLEKSGPVGRFAGRLLDDAIDRKKSA